jgi:glycerol-3-phosphate dehydrogenase
MIYSTMPPQTPTRPADGAAPIVDLLIIGAGINGAGIARDAAGRGLSVLLCDRGDIAGATSSASSKLIHGGLRYLEYYEFRLVAEALAEREVLMRIAPHLTWPLAFVMPHGEGQRPAWMIRAGLMLYDVLGRIHRRTTLPRAASAALADDPRGAALQAEYRRAFVYSDVATDDARLTLANVRDAHARGATVLPRTRFIGASRSPEAWTADLESAAGESRTVRARAIVNAAGPWVGHILGLLPRSAAPTAVCLVRGSHIVVPRLYEGKHAYTLQNDDRRICFLLPFEGDYTLIGTTDVAVASPEPAPSITSEEIEYLCSAANRYLKKPLQPSDIVWSFSGLRALADDGRVDPAAVTRDYAFALDTDDVGRLPVLSVVGGKLTTHRTLAEAALERLRHWFPAMGRPWTEWRALPGGHLGDHDFAGFLAALQASHPHLPGDWLTALARRHGSDADNVIGDALGPADLGRHFGGGLYEREVRYCIEREWARTAEDVLWRRTKCGLRMTALERKAFVEWFGARAR